MRFLLTRHIDKERSFVNGTLGVVEMVLWKDVFIMKTRPVTLCRRILVQPGTIDGKTFMPCTYAYAMILVHPMTLDGKTFMACTYA